MKLKILELFSGYGSQKLALERLGFDVVSEISEIDKYAIKAYEQLHGATLNHGDITKINAEKLNKDFDIITYSSPCQDFSVAGKQLGGTRGSGTRSSLLWECERIIAAVRPKFLLMENVKNLTGKRFKPCFNAWLKRLELLGYRNYWQVLNAKNYGIPQNRERVFVISIRNDIEGNYVFPEPVTGKTPVLSDFLEKDVNEKFFLNDEKVKTFLTNNPQFNMETPKTSHCLDANYFKGTTCKQYFEKHRRQLVFSRGRGFSKPRLQGENAPCLTDHNWVQNNFLIDYPRVRRLTPREYFRLMGVKDIEFNRLKGISNTQLYKMAGNSIVVNVLVEIFRNLLIKELKK